MKLNNTLQIATREAIFVIDLMTLCRQPGSGNGYKVRTFEMRLIKNTLTNYKLNVFEIVGFLYDMDTGIDLYWFKRSDCLCMTSCNRRRDLFCRSCICSHCLLM